MNNREWKIIDDPTLKKRLLLSNNKKEDESEWHIVNNIKNISEEEPKESLFKSLLMSTPRIGMDVLNSLGGLASKSPEYISKGINEISGLPQLISQHPENIIPQIVSGLTGSALNLYNLPHDIAKYGSERLNLLPKGSENIYSSINPETIKNVQDLISGEPTNRGESLIRGIGENIIPIKGASLIGELLNPMKLTSKNIAKGLLETEKSMKNKYSGLYNNLWERAEKEGYGDLKNVKPEIDFETIEKYTPQKKLLGLKEFINDPNIRNAHNAKSDLLKVQRELDKLTTKNTAERKQYKAVSDAINDIQDNMFKNKNGEINPKLKEEYNQIQYSYPQEVLPYTGNKSLQSYKRGELLPKTLIGNLGSDSSKFMAKRGEFHPEIARNLLIRKILTDKGIPLGIGGGIGALLSPAIYNAFRNKAEQ